MEMEGLRPRPHPDQPLRARRARHARARRRRQPLRRLRLQSQGSAPDAGALHRAHRRAARSQGPERPLHRGLAEPRPLLRRGAGRLDLAARPHPPHRRRHVHADLRPPLPHPDAGERRRLRDDPARAGHPGPGNHRRQRPGLPRPPRGPDAHPRALPGAGRVGTGGRRLRRHKARVHLRRQALHRRHGAPGPLLRQHGDGQRHLDPRHQGTRPLRGLYLL